MTFLGWVTIFGFAAILTVLALPLGRYMAAVYSGERTFLDRIFRGPERLLYKVMRVDPAEGSGLEGVRQEPDHLLARRLAAAVSHPAHADPVEFHRPQPTALPLRPVERHVQHDVVVRDEHELAVLRRRDDDDLLQPDGGARRAELPLGGGRYFGRGRGHPRHHLPVGQEPRQLLAGPRSHDALRPAADRVRGRSRARLPGLDPELLALRDRAHADGWSADDRPGTGRLPGGDQGARDERRRVLQRQLGASRSRIRPASRTSSRCSPS